MAFNYKFKEQFSLEERQQKAQAVLTKFQDRVPVICERDPKSSFGDMDKSKILVPKDLSVAQFIKVIRKRISLDSKATMYLFISGKMVTNTASMADIYQQFKDKDGFLYVVYASENVFG